MTTSDTRERAEVRRALDLLKPHLINYLGQVSPSAEMTPARVADIQVLLKRMIVEWDSLCRGRLPSVVRTYLHELLDFRNRWAHEEPLSAEDSARAVDTVNRAAKALGASCPLVTTPPQEPQHPARTTPAHANHKLTFERATGIPAAVIEERGVIFRINRLYFEGMSASDLYDTTRAAWRIGSKRDSLRYAFAVVNGIVKEVYEIEGWHPAGTTLDRTKAPDYHGRWEFVGRPASEKIRQKYIGHFVLQGVRHGAANPVLYTPLKGDIT